MTIKIVVVQLVLYTVTATTLLIGAAFKVGLIAPLW